ncbi:MAG TPA: alpha/beta family hydrolase, partial [Acidimicrobiales bacterium]|nr:alpha/beta family hydrolase [Acidimicrobiales bacterium]
MPRLPPPDDQTFPPSASPGPAALLLAPGAGAGSDQPSLVAIDEAVTAAGVRVSRMDFPYRLAG